ncbi:phosphatase domain-containing protein [Rhodohalobacter sp. 614A]|uniref:phosphatase domain-containing protein n=1 Tax=Rhodohalobacter sp. 614A TaxID=2908649 RepID=UPI001F452B2B|nr:phosphatase domain-containing protein [Rhodohalobacter sp. 614A]
MLKDLIIKAELGYDKLKYRVKNKLDLYNDVIIFPYRGFGNEKEAFLRGRILEKEEIIHGGKVVPNTLYYNLKKTWKRYASDEIPGVGVKGTLNGVEANSISDDEGYFDLHFKNLHAANLEDGWYNVDLEITQMPVDLSFESKTTGEVLISKQSHSFGIISDIDDTIIHTDIINKIQMVLNTIRYDSENRVAFEGVPELYRELTQTHKNPLLFVSGSSYNLYEMLDTFCRLNNIPKAPFVLRDLGIGPSQWIKESSHSFKTRNIEMILDVYDKLPFILIGDSGEEDPEIYLDIHKKYPGRVMAIYIRHVHSDARKKEIREMTKDLDIPFLLMKDSHEALEHAKSMGWIQE